MRRRGFTITELLTVISIIGLLLAIALGALTAVRSTDHLVTSQHHMRQIAQWMNGWSTARNDVVLPASFNYLDESDTIAGTVGGARYFTYGNNGRAYRETNNPWQPSTSDPRMDLLNQGTWADILWVDATIGQKASIEPLPMYMADGSTLYADTTHSQPGRWLYTEEQDDRRNPLRSTAPNTFNYRRANEDGSETIGNEAFLGVNFPPTGMPLRPTISSRAARCATERAIQPIQSLTPAGLMARSRRRLDRCIWWIPLPVRPSAPHRTRRITVIPPSRPSSRARAEAWPARRKWISATATSV